MAIEQSPRFLSLILLAAITVALAACAPRGQLDPPRDQIGPRESDRAAEEEGAGQPPGAPPSVIVSAGDKSVELKAWTYCFGNGCADGSRPVNLHNLGSAPRIEVAFPLEGWTFEAEFAPTGEDCPRRHMVPVEQTGDHTYVVEPAGFADTYDVTLFGRGNGDLFVTFRWTTPTDGPMPNPRARLAVLADHDGAVDSYGVELELADLAATPENATAEVTVTAANGESVTFAPILAPGCMAEGTLYWDGPDQPGLDAATLGPGPFTYDVVVKLDGVEHSASAVWPDDQIEGNEPSVALDFTPPLPSLPLPSASR